MLSKNTKKLIFKAGLGLSLAMSGIVVPMSHEGQIVEAATIETSGTVTVTANALWTYSKPDWNAKNRVFNKNTQFKVVKKLTVENGEMYQLDNGLYISANAKYVSFKGNSITVTPLPNAGGTVTTANLNLRSGAGTSNRSLKIIPKGATVKVLSVSNGWANIEYQGVKGYASAKYLKGITIVSPAPVETPTPAPATPTSGTGTILGSLNMRKGPSTSNAKVMVLPKGATVEVLSQDASGWYKVSYKGNTGYVSNKYIKVTQPVTPAPKPTPVPTPVPTPTPEPVVTGEAYQVTGNLNMRKGPGTTNGVVMVLPKDAKVTLLAVTDGWAKVDYNGKIGYASMKYLRKLPNTSPVPVPTPVPEPKPEPVPVPEPTPVPTPVPEPVPTPVPEPTPPPVPEKYVPNYVMTTAYLNMRKGPDASQPSVMTIPSGMTVKVLSVADNGWMELSYNGVTGFSSGAYLKEVKDEDNVLLRASITIDNLVSGDAVPKGSYTVQGTVSDKSISELQVLINGVLKGTVSVSDGKYSYALNPALMTQEINTLRFEHKNGAATYYGTIMLKGVTTNTYTFQPLDKNIDYYLQLEFGKATQPVYWNGSIRTATMEEARKEMESSNFVYHDVFKYMFMDLSYEEGTLDVSAEMLNQMLAGKGILDGTGEAFLRAANENKVNPFYLVAHALLETGNGTSVLANGQKVEGKYQIFGNLNSPILEIPVEDKEKLVYNMYGIGAYDGNANLWGAQLAYTNQWFTVEDAIVGGAKWISLNYVNRASSPQNTLFQMKWNFTGNMGHQYATDIQWAYKQAGRIKAQFDRMGVTSAQKFVIPVFRK